MTKLWASRTFTSVLSVIFDTILLTFTVWGSWGHISMSRRLRGPAMLHAILLDGVWIYLTIVCKYLILFEVCVPPSFSLCDYSAFLTIMIVVVSVNHGTSTEAYF